MRLYPSALEEQLLKNIAPIYVLHGPETFLVEQSAALIRHAFQRQQTELKRVDITKAPMSFEQGSLFSETQLIELPIDNLNAKLAENLDTYLNSRTTNTYFLIISGKLTKQQQQAAWFLHAAAQGVEVAHWPLRPPQFLSWVLQRAKSMGLHLDKNTVNRLIYHTEGNCWAAAQELQRLAFSPSETEGFLPQQSSFSVSDWCDAALAKQPSRVIKIFNSLAEIKTNVGLLIWALSQTLRRLHQQDARSNQGALWINLLSQMSQIDKLAKSGKESQAWQKLLDLSLVIAS
jgi:DNA polymerase-3 subunit delta